MTYRTEFKGRRLVVILFVVHTYESIEMLRELSFNIKVLEMNDRCASVVLSYVFSRIFAADVYPAGVKLRLEIFRGNLLVENIKTVFAVDPLEF